MRCSPCFVPNHGAIGTNHRPSLCLSLLFLKRERMVADIPQTPVILEPGHRVGRWPIGFPAHRIKSKLYCGILFLPNTSLTSFYISHGPPSLWSHLTLSPALFPLYLLCFCFTCPMSINRNSYFSGSSLNSTSFRKTFLNLIPVLLPAPTPNSPPPARVYAYFLLWSKDHICISLGHQMLQPNVLRPHQPERWTTMVCGLPPGLADAGPLPSPQVSPLFQEFSTVMVQLGGKSTHFHFLSSTDYFLKFWGSQGCSTVYRMSEEGSSAVMLSFVSQQRAGDTDPQQIVTLLSGPNLSLSWGLKTSPLG